MAIDRCSSTVPLASAMGYVPFTTGRSVQVLVGVEAVLRPPTVVCDGSFHGWLETIGTLWTGCGIDVMANPGANSLARPRKSNRMGTEASPAFDAYFRSAASGTRFSSSVLTMSRTASSAVTTTRTGGAEDVLVVAQ